MKVTQLQFVALYLLWQRENVIRGNHAANLAPAERRAANTRGGRFDVIELSHIDYPTLPRSSPKERRILGN